MIASARRIRANERIEECSIQAISIAGKDYYEDLTKYYRSQIVKEEIPALAELPKGLAGKEAKAAVLSMFRG